MKPTAIIQARTGSTRLPNKVLMRIAGVTMLQRVVDRVRMAKEIKQVVVATSDREQDLQVVALCEKIRVPWYRGPELDVLRRYLDCADHFEADPIVRVTADCPFIDPGVLNELVRQHYRNSGVFVTNNLEKSFPNGLDAECFSMKTLREASSQVGEDYDKEHVTGWMRKHFAVNLRAPVDLSELRLTIDTEQDLKIARLIYRAFAHKPFVSTEDVVWLVERRPDIASLMIGAES